MQRIGILSDTHSYLDERILAHFKDCDEIWHAGDIGNNEVTDTLEKHGKLRAVFGNIDGGTLRTTFKEFETFQIEKVKVVMVHIAGPFKKYHPKVKEFISLHKPQLLVCGHSHILKVAFDDKHQLLYLNPGACGKNGFHKVRTIIKLDIDNDQLKDLKVIELGKR